MAILPLQYLSRLRSIGLFKSLYQPVQTAHLLPDDVKAARQYITDYWPQLQRSQPQDQDSLIGLPHPYLVPTYEPNHDFDFNEMYYWDSYFMVQGMLDAEHQSLVEGILENLLYLCGRYGMIPNATRTYLTGRSQPPLLTTFIFDVYQAYHKDDSWLQTRMAIAKQEYHTVWMGTAKPHNRQVYQGLSRNYSADMTHDQAECESGWDYTPRFARRALDFLPVDLNALLYKYETDFALAAKLTGNDREAGDWHKAALRRKRAMNQLMWNRRRGLFYDYDYTVHGQGSISSLAAYYSLWAGLATKQQAKAMVRALQRFEYAGGLATTDNIPLNQRFLGGMPTQWAYPNGWAPLHLLIIRGLERYGHHADARRLADKWLRTNLDWFEANGIFLEKYNVVEPSQPPSKGVYPSQTGFGWTNAVFERLCQDYVDR